MGMETSGWWMGQQGMKVVCRSAGIIRGAQFVMIAGHVLMQLWHADSWDFLLQVML